MLQDLKLDRWCNRAAFESVIKTLTSVRKAMDHCEDQSWRRKQNRNLSTSEERSMETIFFKVGPLAFFVDFLTQF